MSVHPIIVTRKPVIAPLEVSCLVTHGLTDAPAWNLQVIRGVDGLTRVFFRNASLTLKDHSEVMALSALLTTYEREVAKETQVQG
jgi:hypothetical protein